MKNPFIAIAVFAGAITAAPLSAQETNAPVAPEATTTKSFSALSGRGPRAQWLQRLTLGPGDLLDISLHDQPESARTKVPVGPDGRISFLQAEGIVATGLTVDELRAQFDEKLSAFYNNPRTVVVPVAVRSKKYYLLGAVTQKGVFPLNRPTTMIEAIAQAGGLETGLFEQNTVELADLSHSFVVRNGKKLDVDFERLFQQGDLSQNIMLEPDDYVFFASAAASQIYVVGAVGSQGVLPYTPNSTVISAITARGGFVDKAYQSRVLVIRGSLNNPERIIVDAKSILAGEKVDFRLQPKDIVYVSRRPWARIEEILDNATLAFIQAAVVSYTGAHVGPMISTPLK